MIFLENRLEKELGILSQKYRELETANDNQVVVIKKYQLPPGWNRQETEILLLIPAGYPSTKLDNFYVPTGLRITSSNGQPQNYNENGHSYLGRQWGQFSFHAEDWTPSEDIVSGHNLLTFMIGVEQRLSEVN